MVEKQLRPEKLRVTHVDRQRTVERLGAAMTAGCLTMAEFEERVAATWAAAVRHDLDALTADLPRDLPMSGSGGRRGAAERMLPALRGASTTWLVIFTLGVMLWGLACLAGGPHLAYPWLLLALAGGGVLLVPLWHAADSWRR